MSATTATRPLVFVNANVVDTVGGTLAHGRDILVSGDSIMAISTTGGALPDSAQVVDATGRFVIPGLIDMHAHPLNQPEPADALALMFLYGVTGFRQMSGTDALLTRRAKG